jgi:hypothetical protein
MAATHYGVMDPAPCPDLEPVARERVASGFRRSAPVDAEPRGRLQTCCRLSSRKPPRGNPERSDGTMTQLSPPIEKAATLLSAPIELAGDWGHMIPRSACGTRASMMSTCSPTASRRACASMSTHPGPAPTATAPTTATAVSCHLVTPRRQQHGVDRRRYWRAGLVTARLPVRPRARPRPGQ